MDGRLMQTDKERKRSRSCVCECVVVYAQEKVCGCELERREKIKWYAVDWGHAAPESQMN